MMGNYHARCGAGEKPEAAVPEVYLLPFALPDDYCSLLSTMRSREISSIIIIQNLAQIKALFEKTWEVIPGNCDTLVYLGGNEQSTHDYISKMLGKATVDKRSSGETRGKNGSSSRNFDVLGRELLTPDEARKLDNKKSKLRSIFKTSCKEANTVVSRMEKAAAYPTVSSKIIHTIRLFGYRT